LLTLTLYLWFTAAHHIRAFFKFPMIIRIKGSF
jgi:hypothetical protein